ncbi:hypothetical protein [Oenococcus oeni]|uniref:Uncharacterized protein n=3 Tax=Oenococcus oeni TaxID=1247 RepID=Q04GR0_OENOB|nr:hypothetical protein [Oenococcus oeni]ABJ56362.1 hypothetical protein OEOE_0401 [Oenococcus oeni PSU-1]EFD89129.1 hypothetical protein AWRIB429_0359 [Oenococcus oeni AWRIB429]EJN92835.1 hypothetical protein AWRIB304_344 [Oenococcus oeni AWRIB304]EJO01124.1 hypothetical protein AWRIB419_724 [Oenococcus oeni AWRIB419]EJO02082.1 hypothetical protein AWRIB318_604 [Oenococcus oeni AWRIB318]EJO02228.1 hypothetical protein AWRIB418_666 [Oenococcus oeni AWRIB418]EJO09577.1 hypothetical protein AW
MKNKDGLSKIIGWSLSLIQIVFLILDLMVTMFATGVFFRYKATLDFLIINPSPHKSWFIINC